MQNKTPIVVLTGLGIVAAAAVAGLTRDRWMSPAPTVVAVAPAPASKAPDQPAATPEAPKPAEQPAATTAQAPAEQPAPEAPAPATTEQQTAAAQPETPPAPQPETQPEAPAAVNAGADAKVPAFDTVRVEKTGEAVIAGTASPGAEVVVKLDGKTIGQGTANGDGAFVVVPAAPLPAGSGALTLEAKSDGAAEATPSEQSVAVIVPSAGQPQEPLVAVVSPDKPTRVLQTPAAQPETPAPATAPAAAPAAEKPAKLVSIDGL
jgi:hypothetical protein